MAERHHFDSIFPEALSQTPWALPFAFSAAYWNAMVKLMWPHSHLPCDPDIEDELAHCQLVVPEPIEADGEKELFA